MANSEHVYRVHPAIGMARVGNSEEYYLGPETMAGLPVEGGGETTGGLPIQAGTESETIKSDGLRDRFGALKRQAARFKIFQYPKEDAKSYPTGVGTEITIGSTVDGKAVTDIIWTVHLANKKANSYVLNDDLGMAVYESAHASELQLRNAFEGPDLNNAARIRRLTIDPGPRAIRGTDSGVVRFDKATFASFWDSGEQIKEISYYPKSFPDDSFAGLYTPVGKIETLGELRTDDQGRLLVLGAYGKACGWLQPDGTPYPLIGDAIAPGVYGDVNADGWFDDTGDGPVSAVLVFDDGSVQTVHGAWVISTDPSYAPQILNAITLWDEVYDTWVRKLDLAPDIFDSRFEDSYKPYFEDQLFPIFRAASLQRWTTNLPERAIEAHNTVGSIKATDDPGKTILTGLAFIRNPNNPQQSNVGAPFMPLSMGDAGKAFVSVTLTQYFFLSQWNNNLFEKKAGPKLGPGEFLDKAVLFNCIGGRFAPGIEMTFIVRDPAVYHIDWQETGVGPFRIRARQLDYNQAQYSQPFLTVGYVPLHPGPDGITPAPLEPGDTSKFMAVPWQTDYNSCATHNVAPNPENSTTIYWSWPAQRPVQIHRAEDVHDGKLGPQKYSVRGKGTYAEDLSDAGRYQQLIDSVLNWHRIGFVIQGSAISGSDYSADQYLEVESELDEPEITPWPMNSGRTDNFSGSQTSSSQNS
jgi:L-lysine epsilon oxidase-like protein